MEPIVNPWLIYGIEMLGTMNVVSSMGIIVSTVAFVFMICFAYSTDTNQDDRESAKKNLWKPAVTVVILLITVIALPTRETAYKMLMASYVTPNNIHAVGKEANETVGALLDNITNHMKELKDNK